MVEIALWVEVSTFNGVSIFSREPGGSHTTRVCGRNPTKSRFDVSEIMD